MDNEKNNEDKKENIDNTPELPDFFSLVGDLITSFSEKEGEKEEMGQSKEEKEGKKDPSNNPFQNIGNIGNMMSDILKQFSENQNIDDGEGDSADYNEKTMDTDDHGINTSDIGDLFKKIQSNLSQMGLNDLQNNEDEIQKPIPENDFMNEEILQNLQSKAHDILNNLDKSQDKKEVFNKVAQDLGDTVDLGDPDANESFKNAFNSIAKDLFSTVFKETKDGQNNSKIIDIKDEDEEPIDKLSEIEISRNYDNDIIEKLDALLHFVSKIKIQSIANRMDLSEKDLLTIIKSYPENFQRFKVDEEYLIRE